MSISSKDDILICLCGLIELGLGVKLNSDFVLFLAFLKGVNSVFFYAYPPCINVFVKFPIFSLY